MKNEAYIIIPNGKEAKNITGKMVDGKLQICYDLQDKFEPKDGDFVISSTGLIFIFKKDLGDTYCERCAESYIGIERKSGNIHTNLFFVIDKGRFATEQEKSEFLERLEKECNKRWNEKNKCLEDVYIPKFGDVVHVVFKETDICSPNKSCICIYPNVEKFEESNNFFNIANIGPYGELTPTIGSHVKSISPASESEKKKLYDKLAQGGKKWNEEKKCLEDIYEPKFGDIVCIEHPDAEDYSRQYVISIFPNKEIPNKSKNGFFDIACIDMEGRLQINSEAYYNHGYVREATIAEKQELFDKLKEAGKRWNPKTKQLENIRWRAERGEYYYRITTEEDICVLRATENMYETSNVRYKKGNYFRTPEDAQKVAEQIKEIFKNSKIE